MEEDLIKVRELEKMVRIKDKQQHKQQMEVSKQEVEKKEVRKEGSQIKASGSRNKAVENEEAKQRKSKKTVKRTNRREMKSMKRTESTESKELTEVVKNKLRSRETGGAQRENSAVFIAEIGDKESWPTVHEGERSNKSGKKGMADKSEVMKDNMGEDMMKEYMNRTPMDRVEKIVKPIRSNIAGRTRARISGMTEKKKEEENKKERLNNEREEQDEALQMAINESVEDQQVIYEKRVKDNAGDDKDIQRAINESLEDQQVIYNQCIKDGVNDKRKKRETMDKNNVDASKGERDTVDKNSAAAKREKKVALDKITEKVTVDKNSAAAKREKKVALDKNTEKVTVDKNSVAAKREKKVALDRNAGIATITKKRTVVIEKGNAEEEQGSMTEGEDKRTGEEEATKKRKGIVPRNERVESMEKSATPQEVNMMSYLKHRDEGIQCIMDERQTPNDGGEPTRKEVKDNSRPTEGKTNETTKKIGEQMQEMDKRMDKSKRSWCMDRKRSDKEINNEKQKFRKLNNPFIKLTQVIGSSYEVITGEERMEHRGLDQDSFLQSIRNKLIHAGIREVQYHELKLEVYANLDWELVYNRHIDKNTRGKRQVFYGPVFGNEKTNMSVFSCIGTREAVIALQKDIVCYVQVNFGGPQIDRLWIENYYEWDLWEFGRDIGDGVLIEQMHEEVMMRRGYTMRREASYVPPVGIEMGNMPFCEKMLNGLGSIGAEAFAMARQQTGLYDWFRVFNEEEMRNGIIQDYEVVEFLPKRADQSLTKYICMVRDMEKAVVHEFHFGKEHLLYSVVGHQVRRQGANMWIDNYAHPLPLGGEARWKGKALDRRSKLFKGDMTQRRARYKEALARRERLLRKFETDVKWGAAVLKGFRENCWEERLSGIALWETANELIVTLSVV
jgi:hypothetical protein